MMDIEQFKLIIDLLGQAGEGASDLIILWILADRVLGYLLGLFGLTLLYLIARRLTDQCRASEDINMICRALGMDCYGFLTRNQKDYLMRKLGKDS